MRLGLDLALNRLGGSGRLAAAFRVGTTPGGATFTRSTTATYTADVADLLASVTPATASSGATITRSTTATYTQDV